MRVLLRRRCCNTLLLHNGCWRSFTMSSVLSLFLALNLCLCYFVGAVVAVVVLVVTDVVAAIVFGGVDVVIFRDGDANDGGDDGDGVSVDVLVY